MTSVERVKFLAEKGDECWLGLSNVEAIKDVLAELEKKDKVIDEMAKEMCYGVFKFGNVKKVKEYFYKKVSDNK